jgi:pyruvate dehydrogenase E1 component
VPNCRAYDPCFASEFAVILDHGMREMLEQQRDVFYYVTLMNENYAQPSLPVGVDGDIVRGLYRYSDHAPDGARGCVRLVGSGAILREVIAAAELLAADWGIASEVWSATSFSELARDAREVERSNRLHPREAARASHVQRCLAGDAPIIAATDYVRAWPQLIASYLAAPFTALGTDGFGRSDTRAALRSFFEVDRHQIVLAALTALRVRGTVDAAVCADAIVRYGIDPEGHASWTC